MSKFRPSLTAALLLGLCCAFGTGAALAARSLDEAIQQVERDTGGRVVSAEVLNVSGRVVYRIKVLTSDGRLRTVQVQGRD